MENFSLLHSGVNLEIIPTSTALNFSTQQRINGKYPLISYVQEKLSLGQYLFLLKVCVKSDLIDFILYIFLQILTSKMYFYLYWHCKSTCQSMFINHELVDQNNLSDHHVCHKVLLSCDLKRSLQKYFHME